MPVLEKIGTGTHHPESEAGWACFLPSERRDERSPASSNFGSSATECSSAHIQSSGIHLELDRLRDSLRICQV
jgi:hypothetical protein